MCVNVADVTPPTMSKIEARLREREEARKAAVAARRLEKEREARPEETAKYFSEQFTSKKAGKLCFEESTYSRNTSVCNLLSIRY